MSRKKDLERLVPMAAKLFDGDEVSARRRLMRCSARNLRKRRKHIDRALDVNTPEFKALIGRWEEVNEGAKALMRQLPVDHPLHRPPVTLH